MLATILGWFWLCMGILFFVKPHLLKRMLEKKTFKKIKKYMIAIAIVLSVLLIKVSWGVPGILAKIVLVLGIIGIFKMVFFFKGKLIDKVLDWYKDKPLWIFRLGACFHIGVAIVLLNL